MSKNLFTKFFVLLLVAGLLFAAAPTMQAKAQVGTFLSMDPAVNAAPICGLSGETTVAVKVGPVDKLQAYDIHVDYDPNKVQIVSVENGDVVVGGFTVPVQNDSVTGHLSLAATALGAPITDLDGGTLVLITLKHKTTGSTVLTLDPSSLLLQSDGEEVPEYIDYPYTITQATSTFTVSDPVVAIGATEYCDLQEAVTAAVAGNTLTVLRDFDYPAKVDIEKEITFDMATFNVTRTGATSAYDSLFDVKVGGDLTLTGTSGSINATGTDSKGAALQVSGGKATLNSGTLKGDYVSVQVIGLADAAQFDVIGGAITDGIVVKGPEATLNVSGGSITSGYYAPITGNGNAENHGTTINISGGTITFPTDVAIYHPQVGTLNITGGTISGRTGIALKAGTLNISANANIIGTGAYSAPVFGGSGQDANGSAILIYGGTGYTGAIDVNITGGTISSEQGYAVEEFIKDTDSATRTTIDISGGTLNSGSTGTVKFTEKLRAAAGGVTPNAVMSLTGGWYEIDPAYYVFPSMETYAAEGGFRIRAMYPFAIVRGTETLLFPTLKAAVDGANAGETISLRVDHTATCPAPSATVSKAVTIELNGFAYDWPCAEAAYDAPLVVDTGGALTIQDSSTGKTGSIKGSSTGSVNGIALKVSGGIATLSSGTLKGDYVSVQVVGMAADAQFDVIGGTITDGIVVFGPKATLNVSGGSITSGYFAPITGNGNAANHGTTINISGGTITFPTDVAIYHPQVGTLNITGGTISGRTGIALKAGTLNISANANIIGTGAYSAPVFGGSGQDANGSAILIYGGTGYTGVIDVNITGGTISSEQGYAVEEFIKSTDTVTRTTIDISGGTLNSGSTGTVKFTNALVTAAGGVTPNAVMSLTGGWYEVDPKAFVYSPYRTYFDTGKGMYGIQAIPPILNVERNIEYFNLQTAVNEAIAGNTLKFQLDYTIPTTVTIDKALTLDLNGKTVTYTTTDLSYALTVGAGGALTIDDTSMAKTGLISVLDGDMDPDTDGRGIGVIAGSLTLKAGTIQAPYAGVYVRPGASMVMDSGTIGGTVDPLYGIVILGPGSSLDINGGTIEATYFAVNGNGTAGFGDTTITIDNASLTSTTGAAIYHPQNGLLTINSGTMITGPNGIEMKAGDLVITGGTIQATATTCAEPTATGNGSTDTGDAILIFSRDTYGTGQTMDVTISGSPVITSNCYALREFTLTGETSRLGVATITGGSFTGTLGAVSFTTNTDANLELLPGGLYNTDPKAFVYVPCGTYLDGSMYGIRLLPTISGLVTTQGRLDVRAGIPLALNGTAYTATSNEMTDVNYAFIGVEPGTYTFTTAQARYLNVSKQIVIAGLDFRTLTSLRLRAGNAMWIDDNVINLDDAGKVGGEWGNSLCPITDVTNNCGDVNFDGLVNIRDLALVGGNMDLTSADAYSLWVP